MKSSDEIWRLRYGSLLPMTLTLLEKINRVDPTYRPPPTQQVFDAETCRALDLEQVIADLAPSTTSLQIPPADLEVRIGVAMEASGPILPGVNSQKPLFTQGHTVLALSPC